MTVTIIVIAIALYILGGVPVGVVTLRWLENGRDDNDLILFAAVGIVALSWPIYVMLAFLPILGWLIAKGVRR